MDDMKVRPVQASDWYKVLGIPPSASDGEVRRAYLKLAKENHPDVNAGDEKAERRFKEISEAYAILCDPIERRRYHTSSEALFDVSYEPDVPPPLPPYPSRGSSFGWHRAAVFAGLVLIAGVAYLIFAFTLFDAKTSAVGEMAFGAGGRAAQPGRTPLAYEEAVNGPAAGQQGEKSATPVETDVDVPLAKKASLPKKNSDIGTQREMTVSSQDADSAAAQDRDTGQDGDTGDIDVAALDEGALGRDTEQSFVGLGEVPVPKAHPFPKSKQERSFARRSTGTYDRRAYDRRPDFDRPEYAPEYGYKPSSPASRQDERPQIRYGSRPRRDYRTEDDLNLLPPGARQDYTRPEPSRVNGLPNGAGYKRWIISNGELCWIKWAGGLKCARELTHLTRAARHRILARIKEQLGMRRGTIRGAARDMGWNGRRRYQRSRSWIDEEGLSCFYDRNGVELCESR